MKILWEVQNLSIVFKSIYIILKKGILCFGHFSSENYLIAPWEENIITSANSSGLQ